jgi:DNA-binding MarR family transcriptional regulator
MNSYEKARLQVVGYRTVQNRISELLSEYGINTSQWVILGWLFDNPAGLRVTALGEVLDVETPLITALLQPLQTDKLVSLNTDPTDGRAKLATLTEKGEELVPQLEKRLTEHMKPFDDSISEADMRSYFQALENFIRADKKD